MQILYRERTQQVAVFQERAGAIKEAAKILEDGIMDARAQVSQQRQANEQQGVPAELQQTFDMSLLCSARVGPWCSVCYAVPLH